MPVSQALAIDCRNPEHCAAGINLPNVSLNPLDINGQIGEEIGLGNQDAIGFPEHHRVFEGFVVALRDTQQCHAGVLPEVVRRGADEVADVLNDEQVEFCEGVDVVASRIGKFRLGETRWGPLSASSSDASDGREYPGRNTM